MEGEGAGAPAGGDSLDLDSVFDAELSLLFDSDDELPDDSPLLSDFDSPPAGAGSPLRCAFLP